ncbi:MAG: hypothetical protein AAGH38_01380 [Pseudomonadota bacterium]
MAQSLELPIGWFAVSLVAEIAGTALLDVAVLRNDSRALAAAFGLYGEATAAFFMLAQCAEVDFRSILALMSVVVLVAALLILRRSFRLLLRSSADNWNRLHGGSGAHVSSGAGGCASHRHPCCFAIAPDHSAGNGRLGRSCRRRPPSDQRRPKESLTRKTN